jgi:hypothetical protein
LDFTEPSPNFPPLPLPPLPPAYDPSHSLVLGYQQAATRPRRVWTVFVTIASAFIAGQLAGGLVLVVMIALQAGGHLENMADFRDALLAVLARPTALLIIGAVTQTVLFLTVICAAVASPVPLVRRLRLNPSSLSPLGYIVTPIGALAVGFLFAAIINLAGIHPEGTLKVFSDAIRKLSPAGVVAAVLIIGVMPAFAEEFLFRGYTQTRLVQRWGRWVAISITALLFGIMHMDPLQGTFAVGFGFYIGYLAEKSGSIRPGMVCHAINNSAQVVLGWLSPATDQEMPRSAAALMAVVAIAVLLLCILYIHFRVRPHAEAEELPPLDPFAQLTPLPA